MTNAQTPPPGDVRAELRLRPEQPRVTRLLRRCSSRSAASAPLPSWPRCSGRSMPTGVPVSRPTNSTTPRTARRRTELAGLPKDYTGIPKLGPALPGGLGRPILSAQDEGKPVIAPDIRTRRADPAEQRRLAEIEAARVAKCSPTAAVCKHRSHQRPPPLAVSIRRRA